MSLAHDVAVAMLHLHRFVHGAAYVSCWCMFVYAAPLLMTVALTQAPLWLPSLLMSPSPPLPSAPRPLCCSQ